MSLVRKALVTIAGVACAGPAWALGTFVAPAGEDVRLLSSRNIVVRHADRVQIISQVKYSGAPSELVWLVPIPNFNDPPNEGVRVESLGQGAFDELEERTRPVLEGVCDGEPTGATAVVEGPGFGPAPNQALPSRGFSVHEIIDGDLDTYLTTTRGLAITAPVQAAIDGMVDQNFMFYAVHFSADAVGVNRVDPIVSISYPLPAGQNPRLPLLPLASAVGPGNKADLRLWVFDRFRAQTNLPTRELPYEQVEFVGAGETNYELVFNETLTAQQTQLFITEFAGEAGALEDAALAAAVADSGATHLTRLRTDMLEAALRNNRFITLREATSQDPVDRTHAVTGLRCGGPDEADVGPGEADVGPGGEADMGVEPDAAPGGGGDGGGGGGGGGCAAAGTSGSGLLALLGLFGLTRTVRRRRT